MTKFAPQKALMLNARDKLTFDEKVVVHRVVGRGVSSALASSDPHSFEVGCSGCRVQCLVFRLRI